MNDKALPCSLKGKGLCLYPRIIAADRPKRLLWENTINGNP